MKFLHLTDLHFLSKYPDIPTGYGSFFKHMTSPIDQLEIALKFVDEFDAVLISGDLVESGTKEDYSQLKSHLHHLLGDVPIIVTLGNHDIKSEFYQGWLNEAPSLQPYNYYYELHDTAIISLDNSHPHYPNGIIDRSQCQWLRETLSKIDSKQIILMMHHHLVEEQFSMSPAQYDAEFYQLIADSRIDMILTGHTHHAYRGVFAGKPYFTADNLSFSGEDFLDGYVRFEERSGINLCVLENNEVDVFTIPVITDRRLLANVKF